MIAIAALLLTGGLARAGAQQPPAPPPGWKLVWSDEFDGPDGAPPDPAKWNFETGGDGFGNHELEYYTSRRDNSRLEGGALAIVARREDYFGAAEEDGDYVSARVGVPERRVQQFFSMRTANHYTSARLTTFGKFQLRYGRAEARIRLPAGRGLWPAFWLLGADIPAKGWPDCGEIDIMENVGHDMSTIYGTIHGPGYSGANGIGSPYAVKGGDFSAGYHIYAVEWSPESLQFSVDGSVYETRTPKDLPRGSRWVFDHPFFIILNLAVGGDWPGSPEPSLQFPKTMLVDYVRIYQPVDAAPHSSLSERQLPSLTPDLTF